MRWKKLAMRVENDSPCVIPWRGAANRKITHTVDGLNVETGNFNHRADPLACRRGGHLSDVCPAALVRSIYSDDAAADRHVRNGDHQRGSGNRHTAGSSNLATTNRRNR
jgi:hypothetical protein